MGVKSRCHQCGKSKCSGSIGILLPKPRGKDRDSGRPGVGIYHRGQGGPHHPGRGQCHSLFWSLTRNVDHGNIGDVWNVPGNSAGDHSHRDEDGGSQPVAYFYKLHGIQEGDHPGRQDQPGAVAPPSLGFYLVQKWTIQAGEDSIHHCGDGRYHSDDTQGKLCNIRKEVGCVKRINIGHQRKAEIAHAEEPF